MDPLFTLTARYYFPKTLVSLHLSNNSGRVDSSTDVGRKVLNLLGSAKSLHLKDCNFMSNLEFNTKEEFDLVFKNP